MPDCLRGCACYCEIHLPVQNIQFIVCFCHNYAVLLSLVILSFFCDYNNNDVVRVCPISDLVGANCRKNSLRSGNVPPTNPAMQPPAFTNLLTYNPLTFISTLCNSRKLSLLPTILLNNITLKGT